MSMLSCFFNGLPIKRFKAAKCKNLLEMTVEEIKLLIETKENQLKSIRLEIAKLLGIGEESAAHVEVMHLICQKNRRVALDIIILFCQQIIVHLPSIESQRECPPNAKEAICSLCFAASRFELKDLLKVLSQFSIKYGKKFISSAIELKPNCGVNKQIIELLTSYPPSGKEVNKFLKEIAVEYKLKWDPASVDDNMTSAFAPDLIWLLDKMQIVRDGMQIHP